MDTVLERRFVAIGARLSLAERPWLGAPQIDVRYPANNSVVSTLTPELLVKGHDPDSWPAKGLNRKRLL